MDISSLLSMLSSSDAVSALSQSSGAKSSQVTSLIKSAIPLLMKGMQQNASTEDGANSLAAALESHAANNISNAGSFLKNVDIADGAKILGHILGGKNSAIQSGLAQKTGLSSSQTSNILASIAPMLLSALGGQKQSNAISSSGLGSMLGSLLGSNANSSMDSMLSAAMADKDGNGIPDILEKIGGLFGFGKK